MVRLLLRAVLQSRARPAAFDGSRQAPDRSIEGDGVGGGCMVGAIEREEGAEAGAVACAEAAADGIDVFFDGEWDVVVATGLIWAEAGEAHLATERDALPAPPDRLDHA